MKKNLIFIIVLLVTLIPLNTYAGDVKSTSIVGKSTVEKGDELTLTYYINFDGVEKNNIESDGVYTVAFEVIYDKSVLELETVSAEGFESLTYQEDGNTYVMSILKSSIPIKHQCIDGVLFCSSYALKITYEVISDSVSSTNVGMGDIEVIFSSMTGEDKEIYDSYLSTVGSASQSSKTIKINKSNKTSSSSSTTKPKTKSNNKYLKRLEIEGYKFTFKKDVYEYEIDIPDDVNELKITVETEDKNATYKITGADDLKKYNNKVFITVMAEDASTQTYTIRKQETEEENKEEAVEDIKEEKKESPKVKFEITTGHIKIGGIILGGIIILIILYNIIRHFTDRKIDKALDDL